MRAGSFEIPPFDDPACFFVFARDRGALRSIGDTPLRHVAGRDPTVKPLAVGDTCALQRPAAGDAIANQAV